VTPAARLQAAIEIVDAVLAAAGSGGAAADTLIQRYFASRRYAGSKDRRAVRELVYAAIRRAGEKPANGRAALLGVAEDQPELAALFDGSPHGPAPISSDEIASPAGVLPGWLHAKLEPVVGAEGIAALLGRAPLDLRANRLKTSRAELLARLPDAVPGSLAPDAFQLPSGTAIEAMADFQAGLFEVQDEGSQLIAQACDALPGETVIDLCAGAGGKTLALAAGMANAGRLIACDVDRARLARLAPRAERAGAIIIETRLLDGGREREGLADLVGQADVVLVDAPCSGSGTWRRNPEARWRLTPERLSRLVKMQAQIFEIGWQLVRPGGRMVYAVCSLLPEEGERQIAAQCQLCKPAAIEPLPFGVMGTNGALLSPARHGTDGFFIARLRRA
jgi:16S rRNA (cytosine967-C5)-methyltransferase